MTSVTLLGEKDGEMSNGISLKTHCELMSYASVSTSLLDGQIFFYCWQEGDLLVKKY